MPVFTPLVISRWQEVLTHHPDKALARYICNGLRVGFRIGFRHGSPLRSAAANTPSAEQHPQVVDEYLAKELSLGRLLGPFSVTSLPPNLHINRFGVIPKGHNTGKFRLITDLSFPPHQSVNDGIDKSLCSLEYVRVDEVAAQAARLGRGALLAKVDIESAYRMVPVHPQDRILQGMRWQEKIYVDPMLPFGLRSAPKIFNSVADVLCWHLHRSGIAHVYHYLDDYIILGPPGSSLCQEWLDLLQAECRKLGVPIAVHKTEGLARWLIFLRILITL